MGRRRITRSTETREHIVDAAADVIRACGLSGATTREIARAAGCAEGTLYKHFDDKESLFLAVLRERLPAAIDTIVQLPRRAGRRTVRRNLVETVRAALEFFEEMLPMMFSLFGNPPLLAKHRQTMRERNVGPHVVVGAIAAYVRAEQRLGRVGPGASPEAAATLVLGGCYEYSFIRSFLGEDNVPLSQDEFVTATVTTMMAGLEPVDGERT